MSLGLAVALLAPAPARSQQSLSKEQISRFKQRVGEGKRLFQLEKYRAAIEQFEAARSIFDHPRLAFNIAQAYRSLGECTNSASAFKEYIRNDRAEPKMRKHARGLLEELANSCTETGHLQVSCTPKKARVRLVRLGGETGQTQPLSGVCPVDIHIRTGRYRLEARADGFKLETKDIKIELNGSQIIHLTLGRHKQDGLAGVDTNSLIAYSAVGLGAAVLIGGVASDYSSVSRMEGLAQAQRDQDATRIDQLRADADSASTRTSVLYTLGSVLVVGGVTWKLAHIDPEGSVSAENEGTPPSVSLEFNPTGFSTRLRW
jgi:HSP20 family molecular chaperone IbpA